MTLKHLITLTILTITLQAATIHTPPTHLIPSIKPNTYFAVFNDPSPTNADFFKREASRRGIHLIERFTFSHLLNAISFSLQDDHQLDSIRNIPNIQHVYPMLTQSLPRYVRHTDDPSSLHPLQYVHSITKVKQARQQYQLDGTGIRVGVVDSGIDYKHPALGGCFGPGCKVSIGYDFVGDDYDPGRMQPAQPDDDPRDTCGGHGTHVAGIIAASPFTYLKNGTIVVNQVVGESEMEFGGVAPNVTLGAYRVFGCSSKDGTLSTELDIVIKALERAYLDKMDVVNLSLGSGSSWPGYPDARACQALVDKGVIVVAAMGNNGEKGLWQSESPAVADGVVAVASVDSMRYITEWAQVEWMEEKGKKELQVELWKHNRDAVLAEIKGKLLWANDACEPLDTVTFQASAVLVTRSGPCNFDDKAKYVQEAGGTALLIINNEPGAFTPSLLDQHKVMVVGISQEKGTILINAIKNAVVHIELHAVRKAFDHPSGGRISMFSNWGPGPQLELKPDIAAPGGLVLSTFPLTMDAYATLSGTSMASPFITASMAVYLQSRKHKVKPLDALNALQTTARPTKVIGTNLVASVFHQGAGLIQLKNAVTPNRLVVSPRSLALNSTDASAYRPSKALEINLQGQHRGFFVVEHVPAVSLLPWDKKGQLFTTVVEKSTYAQVDISPKRFYLLPGQKRSIKLTFSGPNLPKAERWLYSGYIRIRSTSSVHPDIHIPYGGMHGLYRTVPVLSSVESGYPVLMSTATNMAVKPKDPMPTFSLKDGDSTYIMYRLAHPCRLVRVHAVRIFNGTETVLNTIAQGEARWLGQNDEDPMTYTYQLSWQGELTNGKVDPGTYKLLLAALHPFGSESAPLTSVRNWQTWTSPVFIYDPSHEPFDESARLDDAPPSSNTFLSSQRSLAAWTRRVRASLQDALTGTFHPPPPTTH